MALRVSSTGSDIVLNDIGITVVHPTIDRDLRQEFTAVELRDSDHLTDAIQDGDLTVKMSIHGSLYPISASDYDPDLLLLEELDTTQDEKHVSHDELASAGDILICSGIFPLNLGSTAAATRNLYSNEAWWITWDAQVGDIVEIEGCAASGIYHVESLSDQQNFILEEDIIDSTGGTVNVYHPGGATKVGVDNDSLNLSDGSTVQDVLEDLDDALATHVGKLTHFTWMAFPHFNGIVPLLGWNRLTDTDASLSTTPMQPAEPGYHSHFIFNVKSGSSFPLTIHVAGKVVDEATGNYVDDTEDITVTATGYYQGSKSWIDAPDIDIVESGKTATADIYRTTYWDRGNTDFTVHGCRLEFIPDSATWNINLQILIVNNDGSITEIDNITFANTDTHLRAGYTGGAGGGGIPGKYKRTNYDTFCQGSRDTGLIVRMDQTGIEHFFLEVTYNGS